MTVALTAADVAAAANGRLVNGDPQAPLGRISIDSRSLAAGDFFVAIRGERFDGHTFAADALQRGALGVLISDAASVPASTGAVVIQAGDTITALQDLARWIRRKSGARVVAITGSAGKTTTKEICAELLSTRYRVFRNKGNLNNHIGLPLSLIDLRDAPDVAVVELGMNLSAHPAPIVQPAGRTPNRQCANSVGSRFATRTNHRLARRGWPCNRLYLLLAQRTRYSLMRLRSGCNPDR
jgi:UDP-N-acetylmuramoyl-tripeptide--D-alanyl-D-alanine ligase